MRKEVDDAVAQAKVILWAVFVFVIVYVKTVNNAKFLLVLTLFQESPVPEPSELFTNMYVKDCGVEVLILANL